MKEAIIRLNSDHIKVKGAEYVQDLVRCRDCKYWWECKPRGGGDCDHYAMNTKPDDFCNYGEVRDE